MEVPSAQFEEKNAPVANPINTPPRNITGMVRDIITITVPSVAISPLTSRSSLAPNLSVNQPEGIEISRMAMPTTIISREDG